MKKYKFSVSDRVKTDLHFVWNFLYNREAKVDAKWYRDFNDAYEEYHEGMRSRFAVVSGNTYGVLSEALAVADDYRRRSALEL